MSLKDLNLMFNPFKKGNTLGKINKGRILFEGENHPNWIDGRSYDKHYPLEFKRKRKKILKRDNYTCQLCGFRKQKREKNDRQIIGVHHIDYNKKNNSETNLITLCNVCNSKVNYMREQWKSYFENKIAQILDNVQEVKMQLSAKMG